MMEDDAVGEELLEIKIHVKGYEMLFSIVRDSASMMNM